MEQVNSKPKYTTSPPFRATQLWNEAVRLLQDGMPTRRHFYRMRYYDNCFLGKEAVEWLSMTLKNNPRFGKNVTTEGTRKLLQHFLKTGVFQSIKGSLVFKDSGLFEIVERTMMSPSRKQDAKQVQNMSLRLRENQQSVNVPLMSTNTKPMPHPHQSTPTPATKHQSWKHFVLQRIQELVPTLSVELLVDSDTVKTDWVKFNVCPQFENIRKKTELPFWVFTAINSVVNCEERESEYTTYAGFERDVYTVVRDYLRHRDTPMVPYNLYELCMYTFNHFHFLDLEMKNRSRERDSVENLVLSMSHEWNQDLPSVLPPNSCFETAFTSDEPVTRIVPQSCVDTLCLASNAKPTSTPIRAFDSLQTCSSFNKLTISPAYVVEKPAHKIKNRRKLNNLRRTQSIAQIDVFDKFKTLPQRMAKPRKVAEKRMDEQSYVNYGLSQSLDDLLYVDDDVGLDFEEAMQSVNCLMKASCAPHNSCKSRNSHNSRNSSCSDLNSSSMESLSTVASRPSNVTSIVCIDTCVWYEDIQDRAKQVFQLILSLMSPVSRTSLFMLLQFIDHLPVHHNSALSKTEMVYDLSVHILSPGANNKNVYSHHMVLSVVYFLVENCSFLFQHLPEDQLMQKISREEILKENIPVLGQTQKPAVYCEQVSRNQYENLGVTSSWLALAELLDQIVNDKKMKSKEKKKRLKQFKESYPHIYKQRFGGSSSNLASLMQFR